MTCGPHDGITIELPNHGAEVRPQEIDLRMQRRHYERAQFKLREEPARLLALYSGTATHANVKIDEEVAHRMVMMPEALSFERDFDDNIVGTLDLHDARKILEQGSIEKSFKNTSVDRVVEYILDQVHDPENIIEDYKFIQEGDADLTATTSFFFIDEPYTLSGEDEEFDLEFDLDPFGLGTRIVDRLGWAEKLGAYTFDFDGATALSAMEEVMEHFGMNWWVGDDGVLYIGPYGARNQIVASQSGNNELALSRYTVTTEAKTVNAVQVHAKVMREDDVTAQDVQEQERVGKPKEKATAAVAEAYAPGVDGNLRVVESDKTFDSLADLEDAAARVLQNEVMGDISGSLEINGLASTNIAGIRDLNVGDYFIAGPGIQDDCNQNVITGLFLVTSVHHQAGPRKGWQISVEVSRIPNPDRLESTSVYYDPQTDRGYESLRTYGPT